MLLCARGINSNGQRFLAARGGCAGLLSTSTSVRHQISAPQPAKSLPKHEKAELPEVPYLGKTENPIDLTFNDVKTAYASKYTKEIIRGIFVLTLCRFDFIVDNYNGIMKSMRRILGKRMFDWLMRRTVYGQFVAGADKDELKPIVARNRRYGVKSMLDFSVEDDISDAEARQKLIDGIHEVLKQQPVKRPEAALTNFENSLEFAKRSDLTVSAHTYYYESENTCDRNMDIFKQCIDAVSGSTNKEGLAAIKITALGQPQLLVQMSDFLLQMERFWKLLTDANDPNLPLALRKIDIHEFKQRLDRMGLQLVHDKVTDWFTLKEDGKIDLLDWSHLSNMNQNLAEIFCVRNTATGEYEQLVPALTEEGLRELSNMLHRVQEIAEHAKKSGVRVMVDAEQTYFQPAIRRIVMELMRRYNKEHTLIFNTYQCYLKTTLAAIQQDLNLCEKENLYFGAKFVRGAYIVQERARSKKLGYEDPINPDYDATSLNYKRVTEEVFRSMQRRPRGMVQLMAASHNEDTVRHIVQRMNDYGIRIADRVVCFGQLHGMCDHISFSLGAAGYSIYKNLPYGSVEEVLPFIGRRAHENRTLLKGARRDRQLLWKELRRRIFTGDIFHKP